MEEMSLLKKKGKRPCLSLVLYHNILNTAKFWTWVQIYYGCDIHVLNLPPISDSHWNIQAVIYWFFLTPPHPFSIPIGEGAQYIMAEIYWMIPSYFQFPLKRGLKYFGCDVLKWTLLWFPLLLEMGFKILWPLYIESPSTDSKNLFFHPYTMKKIPKIYN